MGMKRYWPRTPNTNNCPQHYSLTSACDGQQSDDVWHKEHMKRFWLSWHETGPHDYKGPWWTSGKSVQMDPVSYMPKEVNHCFAAVLAENAYAAQTIIMDRHLGVRPVSFLFVQEMPSNWEPFSDRFPQHDWMEWPKQE